MMQRKHIAALTLSAAGLVGIALNEAYRDKAYVPVAGDVPTIGFGTTSGVKMGDKTTPDRALVLLLNDATKFQKAVQRCAPVPMYQHEFDVWVTFTYNVGEKAFCTSTAAKKLNELDYAGACKELLRWNKVKGVVVPGLNNVRRREYAKCLG